VKTKQDILKQRPITPEARERIDEIKRSMELQVRLHELRERRGVTQTRLAEEFGSSRPNVARIEQEDDIRLSTLERYVAALGGRVKIHAVFDDEDVPLN
jgi:predicted transcriptional regulator